MNYNLFLIIFQAQEVALGVYPAPSVTTEVTIIVTDVNDETPTFLSRQYTAEINENAEVNVPVNLIGSSVAEVFDHDQVSFYYINQFQDIKIFKSLYISPSIKVPRVFIKFLYIFFNLA